MLSRLVFLLICGYIAEYLGNAQKLPRAKRQSLKVQINATSDTITMKFLRPSPSLELEGFILGYGSNFFSSQYIPLPANGKFYETEVDAEPRYLIAVKPSPTANPKKSCSGKNKSQKPLQVVVGTLTPTSVFLSWGILINPQYDWTVINNCPNGRFYTVRYREKDKNKKWLFHLCPTTETIIENLKPNAMYEFGVKDNSEDGVWNKAVNHKIDIPFKNNENGQVQNTYKIPRGQIQMAPVDMKTLIAIHTIKQGIQNLTHLKHFNPKSTAGPSPSEAIPGHKRKQHGVPEPTTADVPEIPKAKPAQGESKTRSSKPDTTSRPQLPVSTQATILTFLKPLTPEDDIQSLPSRPRPSKNEERPSIKPGPHNLQYDPSTPENSEMEKISQTESVTNSHDLETTISLITSTPQVLRTTLAVDDTHSLSGRPKASDEEEISETKPVTSQTTLESIASENLNTLEWVRATGVSNGMPFVPPKADQSASPEMRETKPVISTKKTSTTTYQTPQEPAAAKISTILKEPNLTMAPIETQFTHSHPKISASPELNPASTDPQFTSSESSISSSPEKPQAVPVVHQMTPDLLTSETSFTLQQSITLVKEYSLPSGLLETFPTAAPQMSTESPLTAMPMPSKHHRTTLAAPGTMPEIFTTKPCLEQPRETLERNTVLLEPSAPPTSKTIDQQKTLEAHPKPVSLKISTTFEPPWATLALTETHIIVPKPKAPASSEKPQSKSAEISTQLDSVASEISKTLDWSTTELVATSTTIPRAIIAPAYTSEQPAVTLALSEKQLIPSLPKASVRPETSHLKPASVETVAPPSQPKITSRPEVPQTKSVKQIVLDPSKSKAEQPRTTLAPKEKIPFLSKPETSPNPDMPQPEPVSIDLMITNPVTARSSDTSEQEQSTQAYRKTLYPLTAKSFIISEWPRTTMAPKTTRFTPSKPRPSSRPRVPQTKPVPTETQKSTEPETTQTSESPHTKAGPRRPLAPINLIRLNIFDDPSISLVPNETHPKTVPSPSKPRTRQTTKTPYTQAVPNATQKTTFSVPKTTVRPHSRSAPIGTITEPSMSKLSVSPQRPKATLGPYRVHHRSPRPKTSARPWSRTAFNGTTPGSVKTKTSGDFNWLTVNTDGRLAGLDISKLLGVSRNTSMEPNSTGRRLVSVSSPPQRVNLPPARPTYMRRRPFPFNNMTGRPGSPGTAFMPRGPSFTRFTAKPTQFSVAQKTQMPKKQPTLSASDLEDANDTIFNPKPKSELDPQGKPRYTAPHVKYIRKDDRVPCSITESVKHFPFEEAANQDITSAPQNPPSNLTIVTVEGCPSFVILDWEQPDNDTVTEYEVISKENGGPSGKDQSILTTNQTHSTVENLKPDTSYEFKVKPKNPLGEGPSSNTVAFNTESADPRVSEFMSGGKDAIWTELSFKSDGFSECKGKQYVKRTWYKKFVGIQLCNSLRYKIYLSDSLTGKFYNIGDQRGHGEDHCQFVDSFLDGRTGQHLSPDQLPTRKGYYREVRQQPVVFGKIGRETHINYVHWYECGTTIPGKW